MNSNHDNPDRETQLREIDEGLAWLDGQEHPQPSAELLDAIKDHAGQAIETQCRQRRIMRVIRIAGPLAAAACVAVVITALLNAPTDRTDDPVASTTDSPARQVERMLASLTAEQVIDGFATAGQDTDSESSGMYDQFDRRVSMMELELAQADTASEDSQFDAAVDGLYDRINTYEQTHTREQSDTTTEHYSTEDIWLNGQAGSTTTWTPYNACTT